MIASARFHFGRGVSIGKDHSLPVAVYRAKDWILA